MVISFSTEIISYTVIDLKDLQTKPCHTCYWKLKNVRFSPLIKAEMYLQPSALIIFLFHYA